VLAVVMLVLLAAYAYPLRVYLAQQAEIANIEAQQSAQLHKIDELTEQRAKWDDDAYIMSQARRRLQYYLPGETPFAVIGGSDPEQPAPGDEPAPKPPANPPWYGKLWSSIEAANRR
jgi:cell division protein FtsB